MSTSEPGPVSAARLAEQLGDQLPPVAAIPESAFALAERVRELVSAVVMTDVDADTRARAARQIADITDTLCARRREHPLLLVRHPNGQLESMLQAGSGLLNPQAPPLTWVERPPELPPGTEPRPIEVRARCTFTESHAGSPSRVYGGVLALVLDEVLGVATLTAGASGMTVALSVSLTGGTPFGVPVDIVGRYTHREGRKSFANGELLVDGAVTARASAIYVQERRDG
jgi:acyl-coenzyme A thioesterase PaaI-like protein